ncbi:tyrosine-type recombinase/integrase [Paenibacillus sabinae]|uniref:Site-specific integrase n=1 Tax=Paenibacillus sabinae T27 TaxID=1268072 RepID=X4ZHL8_9BACL|nr:tyrosine-type recombinase/integrase [Paenibacillus sabinae]AHV99011.1 site-specific integrase [Paenibacillus sabinae T27]
MDRRIGKRYKFNRDTKGADKQLDDLFAIFINAKASEGRSKRTIESYTEYYRYFCNYMDSVGIERTFTAVTPNALRAYMNWMLHGQRKWEGHPHKSEENMTLGLSPVTVNTKMKAIKAMFRFLHEEGVIDYNPAARIGKVPEPEKKIRILTVDEMQRLLDAPDKRTYAGFRDYTAMHVLIDSFARVGELLSLRESSIDFKIGMVHFDAEIVKTRRGRSVPVSDYTLRLLKELIKENADFESDYLFLSNYGEPLRDDRLRDRIKQHAKKAGIDANVFLHLFRHTSATIFMEKGGSLRHLAAILGHTDPRSTMRYTTPSDRALKAQHNAFSPLNDVLSPLKKPRKTKRKQ